MVTVTDVAVRMMMIEMVQLPLTAKALHSITPGYAWLALRSPRSPGANGVSPRCGWTIGLICG